MGTILFNTLVQPEVTGLSNQSFKTEDGKERGVLEYLGYGKEGTCWYVGEGKG